MPYTNHYANRVRINHTPAALEVLRLYAI